MSDIVRRKTEREAGCRGCDKILPKGTEVIYKYSKWNRGQHIFFCLDRAKKIGELACS